MGIVNKAVEDGICECRFADDVVPCGDRQLAGDQDRAVVVPVLDDFHEVAALTGGQAIRAPVIEDEQVGLHQGSEQARKASVAMGKVEVVNGGAKEGHGAEQKSAASGFCVTGAGAAVPCAGSART